MARQLKNPNQTSESVIEVGPGNVKFVFMKNNGYFFSDDKAMDEAVDFFKAKGFVEVGKEKKVAKKKVAKK